MSNFQRLISSVESYINNLVSKKSDKDHDHTGYAKQNELSEVAFSGSYNDLTETPNVLDSLLSCKKFTITSTDWILDSNNNFYNLNLNHNLNSKDIIVNCRNSSTGYNIILSSVCIDENNIKIYNDDNPECTITIISI